MTQNISEFELHLRAILGLPIPEIKIISPGASRVILAKGDCSKVAYLGIENALKERDTNVFLFGKPNSKKGRRMGVSVALGENVQEARKKADQSAGYVEVIDKNSE